MRSCLKQAEPFNVEPDRRTIGGFDEASRVGTTEMIAVFGGLSFPWAAVQPVRAVRAPDFVPSPWAHVLAVLGLFNCEERPSPRYAFEVALAAIRKRDLGARNEVDDRS